MNSGPSYRKDTEPLSLFYVFTCIIYFQYLSITYKAFIPCYIMWQNIFFSSIGFMFGHSII